MPQAKKKTIKPKKPPVRKKKVAKAEEQPFRAEWQHIAREIIHAFKKRSQKRLRRLNDVLLKQAVTDFTKPLYKLAVVAYILSKIVSKPRFLRPQYADGLLEIEYRLEKVVECLGACPESDILERFEVLDEAIKSLEQSDQRFFTDLITKGRLKVAATMYAQGVSLGVASEMTGIDKHDILDYAGKTMMFDRVKEEKDIKSRLKAARQFIMG